MTQKWNLQDIRPTDPKRRRPSPVTEATDMNKNLNLANQRPQERTYEEDEPSDTLVIKDGNKESKKNVFILAFVAIFFIAGIFGLSFFVSKTTITVNPEFSEPNVNAEFSAYPDRRDGQLSYEVMSLSESGEVQVTASGQENVEEQAKGFIEIIKTTPGTERLIKNTRFNSPDGLTFKIQESVVVPGAIKDSTGALVPGTIRAEVFAEKTGQEYNLAAGIRFDIPGFKESKLTELYNAIYATNREAFTGGFNGPRFIIDETELSTKKQELQIGLRDKLLARIATESPADFLVFTGAVAITYNSLPAIQHDDNLVIIREEAVLQIPLFKQADFASFIAEETVPSYAGSRNKVRITNPKDLTFAYTNATTSSSNIANLPALNFSIMGKPQIVSEFDSEQLKADLAGKDLTAITTVLTGHPGIKTAKISGKPFWRRTFPESKDDIVVVEVILKK